MCENGTNVLPFDDRVSGMQPDVSRAIDEASTRLYRSKKVTKGLLKISAILVAASPLAALASVLPAETAAWVMSAGLLMTVAALGYYELSKKTIFFLMDRKTAHH
jgi:hypothetical protein